jgi:hypothetical protein
VPLSSLYYLDVYDSNVSSHSKMLGLDDKVCQRQNALAYFLRSIHFDAKVFDPIGYSLPRSSGPGAPVFSPPVSLPSCPDTFPDRWLGPTTMRASPSSPSCSPTTCGSRLSRRDPCTGPLGLLSHTFTW